MQTNKVVSQPFYFRWKAYLYHLVTLLAIALIVSGTWITQSIFEDRLRVEKGEVLTAILEQSEDALLDWHRTQKKAVLSWAQTYMIRELATSLQNHPVNPESLKDTLEQDVLREMLSPLVDANDYQGFFIISTEKLNLASHFGHKLGEPSDIPGYLLDQALAGQVVISHPQKAKVLLPDIKGRMSPDQATMFSVAPIRNQSDEVISLLALRINPAKDFTSIMQQGQLGVTGGTYAFNNKGLLMSESRLDQQLWDIGLLDISRYSILNVYLRNPGGNMLTGYRPELSKEQQPLTMMAAAAIAGKNGINLDGYNDYRGVPVIGAWHWNESLNLGMAIEMDVEEAYATLYVSRKLMIIATGLTVIVILVLYIVFMIARKRVQKTEASLVNAQRMAHLGSWDWDITHDRLEWSDETFRIFGINRAQFAATYEAFMNVAHPGDREMINDAVENAIKNNQPYAIEHRIVRPDGTERIVFEQAEVVRDYAGKATAMRGSVLDITQSKKAEQELTLFKTTSDMVEDSLFMFDPQSLKFFYVNQAAIQQLGYSAEELFEMTPLDIEPEYDAESFRALIYPLIEGPDRTSLSQTMHRRKNGSLLPVDIVLQYLEPKDENPRFVAVVRDFSERKRIEQELKNEKEKAVEATRSKSEFLANMSHEIRTPMNGVLGMLELMEYTPLGEKQKKYLSTAKISAKSLLTIINDILDFSKIEAGHMHLENIVFNLHETIEETVAALAKQAENKNLELSCYIPVNIAHYVSGDPVRLRQVVTNLVNNAIKFTEKGEVSIRVRHVTDNDKQVCLGFEVKDTGVGVEKSKLDSLFSAFMQADGSTTRKYGGTGLGLSICRQLVTMMGGEISVTSIPGEGSTFSFIAFFNRLARQVETQLAKVPENLNVLVVDNNDTARLIVSDYLTGWNIQNSNTDDVYAVLPTLRDAVSRNEPYHAVLLNHFMPKMDSEKLVDMIKSDPELSDTHLILLGTADGWSNIQLTRSGIECYIIKPLRQVELYNSLLQVTGQKVAIVPGKEKTVRKDIHFKDVNILLVDDVTTNQVVGSEMLGELGIKPVIASNGQDALRKIRKEKFDLVLMDCQMPVMDGYAATEIIRTQEKVQGVKHLPVIALTAHAMEGDKNACLAAGMDDYVPKPLTMDNLIKALLRWLPEEAVQEVVIEVDIEPVLPDNNHAEVNEALLDGGHVLDANVIEQLQTLSGERFPSLVDSFERDVEKAINALRTAIDNNDAEGIQFSAHAMKSASMSMAAIQMSGYCKKLEAQARENSINDPANQIIRIEQEKVRVLKALRALN